MKVLIIGSGGREHALAWKLAQSPDVTKLWVAPGNVGMEQVRLANGQPLVRVEIPVKEIADLAKFADENKVDLTVVGPEEPLVNGIVDRFMKRGRPIFGPTAAAARLEGSKAYAKTLCSRYDIPGPKWRQFQYREQAIQYLETSGRAPLVVKADGLAAGKGVAICQTIDEAVAATNRMMQHGDFGSAGNVVVFEEFLTGQEMSLMAITDSQTIVPLEPAQDHKQIGEGDTGPNTGGMGTYSPLPQFDRTLVNQAEHDVILQAIHATRRECDDSDTERREAFRGCLFAGLMMTEDGPKVLEYNVRFGDPETQTLVRRLKSDLLPLLWHTTQGTLDQVTPEWDPRPAVTVVLAAGGYPGKTIPHTKISGIEQVNDPDVVLFHAGTKRPGGQWMTSGGRVLGVSAIGDTLEDARKKAYDAVDRIEYVGRQYRKDIGFRALRVLRIKK